MVSETYWDPRITGKIAAFPNKNLPEKEFGPMLRKITLALVPALAIGGAVLSTSSSKADAVSMNEVSLAATDAADGSMEMAHGGGGHRHGGFRHGGFRHGGHRHGGFRHGGWHGGFRHGGWHGGFRHGGYHHYHGHYGHYHHYYGGWGR